MALEALVVNSIAKFGVGKILNSVYSELTKRLFPSKGGRIQLDQNQKLTHHLERNAKDSLHWAQDGYDRSVSDSDPDFKRLVSLEVYSRPLSEFPPNVNQKVSFKRFLKDSSGNILIVGRGGYGKTTLMRRLAYDMLTGRSPFPEKFPIPICIRVRELDPDETVSSAILRRLGATVTDGTGALKRLEELDPRALSEAASEIVNSLKLVVLIDGVDEAGARASETKGSQKEKIVSDLERLVRDCSGGSIVVTSRPGEIRRTMINTRVCEIAPLSEQQIDDFLDKKYGSSNSKKIKGDIKQSQILGTQFVPMTLAFACRIYEQHGKVPSDKRDLYHLILEQIIQKWDNSRDLTRPSNFSDFGPHRKRKFLNAISYAVSKITDKDIISTIHLSAAFDDTIPIFTNLSHSSFYLAFEEIESHTGLIYNTGTGYAFSHRTMREYLCASHILDMPTIPVGEVGIERMANELAIAISISENPSTRFAHFILVHSSNILNGYQIYEDFLDRIWEEDVNFSEDVFLAIAICKIYSDSQYYAIDEKFSESNRALFRIIEKSEAVRRSLKLMSANYSVIDMGSRDVRLHLMVPPVNRFSLPIPTKFDLPYEIFGHIAED